MDMQSFVQQCHQMLLTEDPSSRLALRYLLDERGLSERTIIDHKIGYCSASQTQPGKDYWALKNRIIIPIFAEFDDLIAVASRSPNPNESGWWNTPFDKNNHLFLLNHSRKSAFDHNKIYLFEGYMDGLVLFQEGLTNVASFMGTSLGYRRIGLLKRYCNRVCLVYDQDVNNAGQRGHDRAVYELSRFHFDEISCITLPIKVDPDEFVIKNGVEEFLSLEKVLTAQDIQSTKRRYLFSAAEELVK